VADEHDRPSVVVVVEVVLPTVVEAVVRENRDACASATFRSAGSIVRSEFGPAWVLTVG
jgi:hypothetical protein